MRKPGRDSAILFAFWAGSGLLLWPFRHFLTQDDATCARQAILMAAGDWRFASDMMAAALPQTAVTALLMRILPGVDPFVIMHGLSWLVFLKVLLLFRRWSGWSAARILALVSVPYWIQYGAGYFYDLFAIDALLIFFLLWEERTEHPRTMLFLVISFLGPLQLQTLLVMNALFLFWAILERRRAIAFAILAGSAFSAGVLHGMPQSLWQEAQAEALLGFRGIDGRVLALAIQYLCGVGFFLLPLAIRRGLWRSRSVATALGTHLALAGLLWRSALPVAAAGVLFTDYLPRAITAFVATAGIWAWVAFAPRVWEKLRGRRVLEPAAILFLALVYGYRGFNDLRYSWIALPLAVHWLFFPHSKELAEKRVALENPLLLSGALALSLLLNGYLVDTTAARWSAAAGLEAQGTPKNRITAGYGRDHFELEEDCVLRAYGRLGRPAVADPAFRERISSLVPRVYEQDWVPEFVIKPSAFAGIPLTLPRNRSAGQDAQPSQRVEYSQWGLIPHALAIYSNSRPEDAWCFR